MAYSDAVELPVKVVSRSAPINLAASIDMTAANTNGHKVYNNGKTLVRVKRDQAGPAQVIFQFSGRAFEGMALGNKTVSLNNGDDLLFGPFPMALNYPGTQYLYITFPVIDGMSIAAYRPANE